MNFRPFPSKASPLFLATLMVLTFQPSSFATASTDIAGEWRGILAGKLRIIFKISKGPDGGLSTSLYSLDQGGQAIPVDKTSFANGTLSLEVKAIKGSYRGTLSVDGQELKGQWTQGQPLPLDLKRSTKDFPSQAPVSILEPHPPFPYRSESVTFGNLEIKIELAGTLTYPRGKGPFPAVVLIQGSGQTDRDETVHGHKPFLLLADALTRAGLAVLRFDKRGVGASTGNYATYTSQDMAQDVRWGLDYLKGRKEVDPKKLGLLGHSEGGIIAPMVSADSPDVSFIVLLAAPGIRGDELSILQTNAILKNSGETEEVISANERTLRKVFEALRSGGSDEVLWEKCEKAVKKEESRLTPEQRKKIGEEKIAQGNTNFQGSKSLLLSPWTRFFIDYDPAVDLARVRCPVLALTGSQDLQVTPVENLRGIEDALKAGKNPDYRVQQLEGLNHLFQTCQTCSIFEYGSLAETMAPSALKLITDWVVERTR